MTEGYIVKIDNYQRTPNGQTVIKVVGQHRMHVDEFYIPEDVRDLYPNEDEALWFARGRIIQDDYSAMEDEAAMMEECQKVILRIQE